MKQTEKNIFWTKDWEKILLKIQKLRTSGVRGRPRWWIAEEP
jgi:hypothetical protein